MDKIAEDAILKIWDEYITANKAIYDLKGNSFKNIDFDTKRFAAIDEIKSIINDFYDSTYDLPTFKTTLDGYNKRNNYWGFPAAKGQMFFNLLTRASSEQLESLSILLRDVTKAPNDLKDALKKLDKLESLHQSFLIQYKTNVRLQILDL